MVDYISSYNGSQVDRAVAGILAYSGSSTDNVRMASQIGLIPNDSTKGSANGAIIASLITAGKSLFMDKDETYYITGSGWEIGYDFSIKGKATIIFSGTSIFKPVANGSISFDGITMKGQEPSARTYLIDNSTGINFFINRISLTNCEFGNFTRVVNISGADIDYTVTPFGIREFVVENCRFANSYTSAITLNDIVIPDRCTVRYNYVDFKYAFFTLGNTNEYTNSGSNSYYDCELVFDSNIAIGQVCDGNYSYCCFVLVEANKVVYTNNTVSNLIGVCGATYDMYANCYEIVYRGNIIRNVCNLPKNDDYTLYTEAFKSKSGGQKHVIGNYWMFDFNEIRKIASDAGYTYTDERFSQLNKVYLFQFSYPVDVEFCNNYIGIKNGDLRCAEASRPIKTMVCESNIIDVDGNITGWMLPAWNTVTQDLIVRNNVFRSNNTSCLCLFGNPSDGQYSPSTGRIVCKGNESTVPIWNVSTVSAAELVFEDNTYKNLPTTFQNIWSTFNYGKKTKVEYYISSDKQLVLYSMGNTHLTLHCNMTSGTPSTILLKSGAYNVDLCFRDIKKTYKIRNDNGTYNVYNWHNVKVATISTSYSNIIVEDSMYISAVYSNADNQIVLKYYNTTGWYDIEIADPALNAFDEMISDNAIPIIAVSGSTLTAETGRYYRYDAPVTSLSVILPSVADLFSVKNIILGMTTGSSPSVSFTSADGTAITYASGYGIEANKSYEINCLFNGNKWVIVSMAIM